MTTKPVRVKGGIEWAHLYGEDLDTIVGEFHPGEVGFMLPGERHYLWHTFRKVILRDKWGWASTDDLAEADL